MTSPGITLLQRWGLAPTASVWIGGNNLVARSEIEAVVASLRAPPDARIDCAFIAPKVADEASHFATKLRARLLPDATVWVAWPSQDLAGLAAVSSALGDAGFDEVEQVALSAEFVTAGFRARLSAERP